MLQVLWEISTSAKETTSNFYSYTCIREPTTTARRFHRYNSGNPISPSYVITATTYEYTTTIKEFCFFQMTVKELKTEETKESSVPSSSAIYADVFTTIIVAAMLCGTILSTTHMWIEERQTELMYLRGTSPWRPVRIVSVVFLTRPVVSSVWSFRCGSFVDTSVLL